MKIIMIDTKILPEGYVMNYEIDMKHNKKLIVWINIMSLVLLLPFIPFIIRFFSDVMNASMTKLYWLTLLVLGLFLMIIIHEAIHGLFFHVFTKSKVKYQFHGWAFSASAPGHYLSKWQYFVVGIAPAVILGTLFLVFCFASDIYLAGFAVTMLGMHFCSCIGDFYVIWKLMKYPKDAMVRDTGVGMEFYVREQ